MLCYLYYSLIRIKGYAFYSFAGRESTSAPRNTLVCLFWLYLLRFHIPPVFQGLVLWFDKDDHYYYSTDIIIIIRNKSNGIQLFKGHGSPGSAGGIRYISRSEMAMQDYCGDDELELYFYSEPTEYAVRYGYSAG